MPERLETDTRLLNISGGRPLPDDPPGFAAFAAPRRAARGRERDHLCLCLSLRARAPVPSERYAQLLDLAASTFFGSAGSVTAALRQAIAAVNQNLLEANLKAGPPMQGGLIGAALRGEDFYAVQGGPGFALVAHHGGLERFAHPQSRPLGLSDALDAHYFHTAVHEGEYLVLGPGAPAGWTDPALAGLGELAMLTNVAERLKETSGGDFTALIGRFEPAGTPVTVRPAPVAAQPPIASLSSLTGLLRPRRESFGENATQAPAVSPPPSSSLAPELAEAPALSPAPPPDSAPAESLTPAASAAPPDTDWQALMRRAERLGSAEPPPHVPIIEDESAISSLHPPDEETGRAGSFLNRLTGALKHTLHSIARAFGITLTEATRGLRQLLARMMPEGVLQQEGLFTIPNSVLMGAALVIPIIVVAIVAVVYIQRGRADEFAAAMEQARLAVAEGQTALDPNEARQHWVEALAWLALAENRNPGDPEMIALQQQAQGELDELDWITRVDFQPLVVGGLSRGAGGEVTLQQIALLGADVYALDAAHNRVLRLVSTPNSGYAVDADFECAGGAVGQYTIGPLVDIGLLPGPTIIGGEAIVALDTTGGLLYCAPGSRPFAAYLPSPETNWIRPTALEVYTDRLYVLDPGGNEVWQFQSSGGVFDQPPARYFVGRAADLQDVIEFSIAGGDLFLLRKDGRITNCTRPAPGEIAACTETLQYSDQRPGRAPGDRLTDVTAPARLIFDPPPEPSLLLLDAQSGGVYQLSLKLLLVRQFRARFPFTGPITAAAVDPAKRLFLAAGDNVYVAERP
jgi:hypothetical protein